MSSVFKSDKRLIRIKELKEITGLSRSTIWRREKEGVFPKRLFISKGIVVWDFLEIEKWITEKLDNRHINEKDLEETMEKILPTMKEIINLIINRIENLEKRVELMTIDRTAKTNKR